MNIKEMNKNEFLDNSKMLYQLAINLKTSSYPTYANLLTSLDKYVEEILNKIDNKNYNTLKILLNDKIVGMIQYYYELDEKYLQLTSFSLKNNIDIILKEFINYLNDNYKDYEYHLGFSDNHIAVDLLNELNFTLIEKSYNNIYLFSGRFANKCNNVIEINKNNFNLFANFIDKTDLGYWNVERLYKSLSFFKIYLYQDCEVIKGAITLRINGSKAEVFCVKYKDEFEKEVFTNLIHKCLNYCLENNIEVLFYFSEEEIVKHLVTLGFKHVSRYVLFSNKVIK